MSSKTGLHKLPTSSSRQAENWIIIGDSRLHDGHQSTGINDGDKGYSWDKVEEESYCDKILDNMLCLHAPSPLHRQNPGSV